MIRKNPVNLPILRGVFSFLNIIFKCVYIKTIAKFISAMYNIKDKKHKGNYE